MKTIEEWNRGHRPNVTGRFEGEATGGTLILNPSPGRSSSSKGEGKGGVVMAGQSRHARGSGLRYRGEVAFLWNFFSMERTGRTEG